MTFNIFHIVYPLESNILIATERLLKNIEPVIESKWPINSSAKYSNSDICYNNDFYYTQNINITKVMKKHIYLSTKIQYIAHYKIELKQTVTTMMLY